jgi:hypothetical protein
MEYLIEYAMSLPPLPDRYQAQRDNLEQVHECQTPVFLATEINDNAVYFYLGHPAGVADRARLRGDPGRGTEWRNAGRRAGNAGGRLHAAGGCTRSSRRSACASARIVGLHEKAGQKPPMSEQPAFSRCPYCRRKLEKKPTRKTKCPHCGEPIYVRAGDLLREDELEQVAAKPRSEKPAKKKPAKPKTSTTAKPKPRKTKPKPQGQLAADLKRKKKKEQYGPDDLLAGLQLLFKVAGALLAGGGLTTLLSNLFGAQPQPATRSSNELAALVQNVDSADLLQAISDAYTSLTAQEQFQMRAVVTWVQNGFQLPPAEAA